MTIDDIELDENNVEFNFASDFVKHTDKLVYLTGKAGTGKTTFLKYLRETTTKNSVVLAFTGVASVNAGGQTINSFFKIPFGPFVPNDKRLRTRADLGDIDRSTIYDFFSYNKEKIDIIRGLELLIIDEISMVRCDLLDVIDRLLRVFRKNINEPFGGVQVILIGDTFQLPPIADFSQWEILKPFYESPFFFSSIIIKQYKPVYIELKKIYRQNEQEFIDLLNRVRINQVSSNEINLLNSKFNPAFTPDENSNYITLATHNNIVNTTNNSKLLELPTELKQFYATITGIFPDNIMPTDKVLQLKEGAQIMFIKNNISKGYYNGKIAKVNKIDKNEIIVEYENRGEIKILIVERQEWNNIKYTWNEKEKKIEEETIGTFSQFPLKLAWAITVHKSQGLTFEKVIADLGAAFASGQVYVALSRCTTFNGLVLKTQIGQNAIKTDAKVLEFAQNETPSTLIVQELNSGKADFFYKKTRENIKLHNFNNAYDNFIKAIKFRNDIETNDFKRYFTLTAKKISLFKLKKEKLDIEYEKLKKDKEHIVNVMLQIEAESISDKIKIEQRNKDAHILHEKNYKYKQDLELEINKTKKVREKLIEFDKLNMKNQHDIFNYKLRINDHENEERKQKIIITNKQIEVNMLKIENDKFANEIIELKIKQNILEENNRKAHIEIERLLSLKWYHKLFGIVSRSK